MGVEGGIQLWRCLWLSSARGLGGEGPKGGAPEAVSSCGRGGVAEGKEEKVGKEKKVVGCEDGKYGEI